MQSLNAKYSIYPVLTFLLGGMLILLLIKRRRHKHVYIDETPSAYAVDTNVDTQVNDIFTKDAKDTIVLEKSDVVKPISLTSEGRPCSRLIKQRNILFVISGLLLIVSLVLSGAMMVQSHRLENTAFNTDASRNLLQTTVAHERIFEKGVAFPHFTPTAYGHADTLWQQGIQEMKVQTSAQWIEIPILFSQATNSDTHVEHSYCRNFYRGGASSTCIRF